MGSLSQCWGLSWKTKGNRWEETENNSWVRTRLGRREAVFCQQPCYNTAPCSLPLMNSFSSIRLPRCVILKQCIMQTDRDKAKVDAIWECVCVYVCLTIEKYANVLTSQTRCQTSLWCSVPVHCIWSLYENRACSIIPQLLSTLWGVKHMLPLQMSIPSNHKHTCTAHIDNLS